MNLMLSFLFLIFACALVFPTLTFYLDYMNSTEWNSRTAISYLAFTACASFLCMFFAMAIYALAAL